MKEKIFYIGFNANNAICNESFFEGSITLYPTGEKGNMFYSNKLIDDVTSSCFMKKYKKFICDTVKIIKSKNKNVKFMCFNEKIRKLCCDIKDIKFIFNNNLELINFLNNKIEIRKSFENLVPTLKYKYCLIEELNYEQLSNELGTNKFVVQGEKGAGGNTTYLVNSEEDLSTIKKENVNGRYSISKYIKHLPINITLIIGNKNIIYFPISIQLILLIDKKFKYVGGDYAYEKFLSNGVKNKIYKYSKIIGEKIKMLGYKGILGIDFLLTEEKQIVFMEVNPRFQASSFLLSNELEKKCGTNLAKMHYLAVCNKKIKNVKLSDINKSFVNCNNQNKFTNLKNYIVIKNGYFKVNVSSIYRKVYNRSIFNECDFEKISEN